MAYVVEQLLSGTHKILLNTQASISQKSLADRQRGSWLRKYTGRSRASGFSFEPEDAKWFVSAACEV